MASATISRTIVKCKAFAWQMGAAGEDGVPKLEKVGNDDTTFLSTKPTKKEAYRALKAAGFNVASQFCDFEVVSEDIYAISLDDFILHGSIVERQKNGRVRVTEGEQQ